MKSSAARKLKRPETIIEEIAEIAAQNGGLVAPASVVHYASNPKTKLHSRFTWDDSIAAHEHRLWQARQVMRICVKIDTQKRGPVNVRAYVSLPTDRSAAGGYRPLSVVLKDPEMYAELLEDARKAWKKYKEKYGALQELEGVSDIIDRALG